MGGAAYIFWQYWLMYVKSQAARAEIRLLIRDQSDLGLHWLFKRPLKYLAHDKADDFLLWLTLKGKESFCMKSLI